MTISRHLQHAYDSMSCRASIYRPSTLYNSADRDAHDTHPCHTEYLPTLMITTWPSRLHVSTLTFLSDVYYFEETLSCFLSCALVSASMFRRYISITFTSLIVTASGECVYPLMRFSALDFSRLKMHHAITKMTRLPPPFSET